MLLFGLAFSVVLAVLLLIVYFLTSHASYSDMGEKKTAFECGFDPLSESRTPFSTRFFLLVVIFLIFDVEVALLFPMLSVLSFETGSLEMASALTFFLLILLFGTFHEWNEGALDWVSE